MTNIAAGDKAQERLGYRTKRGELGVVSADGWRANHREPKSQYFVIKPRKIAFF